MNAKDCRKLLGQGKLRDVMGRQREPQHDPAVNNHLE